MGTSIGAATNRLLDLFTNGFNGTDVNGNPITTVNGPATPVQALSGVNANVEVADVSPLQDDGAWFIVGRAGLEHDAEVTGSASYRVLGLQRIDESYAIPCLILLFGQGPGWGPVRDGALALFDGAVKLVAADPTLGGVLQQGRIASVANLTVTQYDPTTEDSTSSGAAVGAAVTFDFQVENSYVP